MLFAFAVLLPTCLQAQTTEKDSSEFGVVEVQPVFPGGEDKFYAYLVEHMSYPPEARRLGIEGRVYVQFIIEKDGSVSDVRVVRGIGAGCDEVAVKVVASMPRWTPGYHKGHPVRVKMIVPLTFKLGSDEPEVPTQGKPTQLPQRKKGLPANKKGGGS